MKIDNVEFNDNEISFIYKGYAFCLCLEPSTASGEESTHVVVKDSCAITIMNDYSPCFDLEESIKWAFSKMNGGESNES